MKSGQVLRTLFASALAILAISGAVAERKPAVEVVDTVTLGGKERYLAHVSTDKPIYREGEKVYARSVVLHAVDHTPLENQAWPTFQVLGPKGNAIAAGQGQVQDSVSAFAWTVPEGQEGGEYTIKVTHPNLGIPPAQRKFDIRAYRAPRIKTQITFFRDGYGPGDRVGASLEATRAEGGIPANAKVKVVARVDGKEIHSSTTVVDDQGNCSAMFELPDAIERGEGSLAFVIEDGGVIETATKTIPILLQTVDLSIYPEGGDLVAGLPCRVYIEAKTPNQKPADLSGVVLDDKGRQVGAFRTEHEGRGKFTFFPRKDRSYELRIDEPSGIKTRYELPEVRDQGTIIRSLENVYAPGQPIVLRVNSTEQGPFTVTLRKREAEIASLDVRGGSEAGDESTAEVTLTPPATIDGVLIATVWNEDGEPLAERLIFRKPRYGINVAVEADRERYVPGGAASLSVTATDHRGRPIEAVVGLTVTDDSVLEMIEKREQAPRLPVMVLLESDVEELADAHVYLDLENPEAPQAVDLLLGTQGWRRFMLVSYVDFLRKYGDDARRVVALRMVSRREETLAKGGAFRRRAGWLGARMGRALPMPMAAARPVAEPVDAAVAANEGIELAEVDLPDNGPDDEDEAVHAVPEELPEKREAGKKRKAQRQRRQDLKEAIMAFDKKDMDRALMAQDALDIIELEEMAIIVPVREYAHRARPNRKPGERSDFTETLYWHAGVKTDAKTGKASISFDLNDSVTSFRVFADAFSSKGALGSGGSVIESVQPFYAEPKLPLEVTMGDTIRLPIGLVNGTDDAFAKAVLKFAAAKGIDVTGVPEFAVAADSRVRRIVDLSVGDIVGKTDFVLDASAGAYSDRVTRKLKVVPRGFPVEVGEGGMLEPNSSLTFTVKVPKTRVPGSVKSHIAIFPTPLANLTAALERLIREPHGCFEQTSSTTYPLVMAQQYFLSHQGVDPKLIERSRKLLDKGYKRLIGFECKQKGYEWFASDPGHEALTAYGLLEFIDMAQVHNVDAKMLERTRAWLLGARDGEGGFKRERRALHTWVTDADASNAYITWALLTAGQSTDELKEEIDKVISAALKSKNSYVIALGANVAHLAERDADAKKMLARLKEQQTKDGHVDGSTTSIVGSSGVSLQVETTSLSVLAWLEDSAYTAEVEKGIQWLAEICKAGRYGSTQSTVLALRAIIAYDAARAKPKAPGSVELVVDGHKAGSVVEFSDDSHEPIVLTDIAELLEPGEHTIVVTMKGGSAMPCAFAVDYANETPASSDACKVDVAVTLASDSVDEGKVVEAMVRVENREEDEIIPSPIAIVGIPGGLEVRHDQLKELVKSGQIAAYEVIGREVVLYWRDMQAGKKIELPISLVAAIPGTYTGPASRAYLYYTDEHKQWADPLKVTITPSEG